MKQIPSNKGTLYAEHLDKKTIAQNKEGLHWTHLIVPFEDPMELSFRIACPHISPKKRMNRMDLAYLGTQIIEF